MKFIKTIILLLFFYLSPSFLFGEKNHLSHTCEKFEHRDSIYEKNDQIVFICNGMYAYAYHSRKDCPGLGNCKGQILYTYESTAISSYRRVPCCKCWAQVAGRCRDDNPSSGGGGGGGGGSGDAMAFVGVVILVTSAAILSNDFYFEPTYSFHSFSQNGNQLLSQPSINTRDAFGYSFGFRKTLKKSAFEYGVSNITREENYHYGGSSYETSYKNRWGIHLNYIHQIKHQKIPNWLYLYVGPTLNYVDDWGYGGILSGQVNLLSRLKLDVRYEFTNQTNQIQAGLIFNYQRKYFWQK